MKHPVDVHVGQRIRRRRWMLGMTQQQLGEGVGIKFQQIQKYETGMNRVSASRLYDISNALDVPIAFFFDGFEEGETDQSKIDANTTSDLEAVADGSRADAEMTDLFAERETLELIRYYYQMPEEPRRRFFELARSFMRMSGDQNEQKDVA